MIEVVLVHDDPAHSGLGHRRRVEALAGALQQQGVATALRVADELETIEAETLVVDSYQSRADDSERYRASTVCAFDDLGRDLAVDVVVDPSPGAENRRHRRASSVCAGAAFALVGADVRAAVPTEIGMCVRRVLVATGAADRSAVGARIAAAVVRMSLGYDVRLVVGPWGCGDVPAGVTAIHTTEGLAAELAVADVVVSAGGVTLLESLALGRPTVALVTAENQRLAVDTVSRLGAAVPANPSTAAAEVAALVASPARRYDLSVAARAVVDGRGTDRVAAALLEAVLVESGAL